MGRLTDTICHLRSILAKAIRSGAEITLDEQNAIDEAIEALKSIERGKKCVYLGEMKQNVQTGTNS